MEGKCNLACKPSVAMYQKECPLHGRLVETAKKRETQGKLTSEGYIPKGGEKVEVRGD